MPILDRTPLNSSDKLDLLAKSIACQAHGHISSLSNEFDISRKAVYRARDEAHAALQSLIAEHLQPEVITTVGVTVEQLQRTIVALATTAPNSIRAIEQLIPLLYPGCKVSYGYIQGVIVRARQQAQTFNCQVPLTSITSVALDEMFSQGDPVLAGIDLDSGYLFSLSHETCRDGDTWENVLNEAKARGMHPAHVIKDGARGIANGVTRAFPESEQRDDAFHALYIAGKAVRRAEQRAYHYIAREEEMLQRAYRPDAPDDALRRWWRIADKCERAMAQYEDAARALRALHAAFGCVCRKTGELMTAGMAQAELQRAVRLLRQAQHKECDKAATYLENRLQGLTLATAALHRQLLECMPRYSQEQVGLACRFFEARRELEKAPKHKRQALSQELLGSYRLLLQQLGNQECDQLMRRVEVLLGKRHRASSAIEGFNATLRSYLYVRKGVNQGFLELFKAWHNLRPRRWGKHRGTSAYEKLTGKTVDDWLTLLGFPPAAPRH